MKIIEYGQIYFDGHQVVIQNWTVQGKVGNAKQFLVKLAKAMAKNDNIKWIIQYNNFLPKETKNE